MNCKMSRSFQTLSIKGVEGFTNIFVHDHLTLAFVNDKSIFPSSNSRTLTWKKQYSI